MEAAELKREFLKAKAGGGARYPAALRQAAVEYAKRAKTQGRSQAQVAGELGVSEQTLRYWRSKSREGELMPVAIVAPSGPSQDPVVEVGALRVRGLDIAGIAELLKRLA